MNSGRPVLGDFPAPEPGAWREEAIRLLKGASFDRVLRTKLPEGIVLDPIYHRLDVEDLPAFPTVPGLPPFLRGRVAWRRPAWRVAQEQVAASVQEAAQTLRREWATGLEIVHLVLDEGFGEATPSSPATAEVTGSDELNNSGGPMGLPLRTADELDSLLGTIPLVSTPVFLQAGAKSLQPLALLVAAARRRGVEPADLKGAVGADPLGEWARRGELSTSIDTAFDELAAALLWCDTNATLVDVLWCHGEGWHDAGANAAQELGFTLATVADSLRALQQRGIDPAVTARHLRWSFAVGSTFFSEVAKLRAARILLHALLNACAAQDTAADVQMHVRTSRRNKSTLDPHTNLLRATTEAFSAAVGGADSIHVDGFTRLTTSNDPFARRLARTLQIILREEAHLGEVIDPAGGSWYVEHLSWELAKRAWGVFQEVESAGGMRQALREGEVQRQLRSAAQSLLVETARGKNVRVGVNKYPAPTPAEESSSKARGEGARAKRTGAKAAQTAAIPRSEEDLDEGPPLAEDLQLSEGLPLVEGLPLAETMVDLALAGTSVADMSAALARRSPSPASEAIAPLQPFRETEGYERLREALERARAVGGGLEVMVVPLGPVAGYMPRLDFTTSFFQAGGFAVNLPPTEVTVEESIDLAVSSDAFVKVLCGRDESYKEKAEETARALKEQCPDSVIALAGSIHDEELHLRLSRAGIEFFIHLGTDRLEILGELARRKGVAV